MKTKIASILLVVLALLNTITAKAAEDCPSITVGGITYSLDPCTINMTMVDGKGDVGFSTTVVTSGGENHFYGISRYGYGEGLPTYAIVGASSGGASGNALLQFGFADSVLSADGDKPRVYNGYLPIHIYHGSERGDDMNFLYLNLSLTVFPKNTPLVIRKNEHVLDQSISIRTPMQLFGSYLVEVPDRAVAVPEPVFYIVTDGKIQYLTSIVLVNQNGTVIAGPVDAQLWHTGGDGSEIGEISFKDTLILPKGTTTLYLRGKVGGGFPVNWRVMAVVSGRFWTPTDLETGEVVPNLPDEVYPFVEGQVMTVQGPALTVSFIGGEQTVVAGSRDVAFGTYVLDATQSSEDVRVVVIPGKYELGGGASSTDLIGLTLYDGATPLTTGSNVLSPALSGEQKITCDGTGFIVPKGTIKTIRQQVNVRNNRITSTCQWSLPESQAGLFLAVGLESANIAQVTITPANAFVLHIVPHGDIAITKEDISRISEEGDGTNGFFKFSVLPTLETFQGGVVTFAVEANPIAGRFQLGNGLARPRLKSGTVSIESVLIPFERKGSILSYLVSFNLMSGFTFPKDTKMDFVLTLEYDNSLQTGDEVTVSFAGNSPTFTGVTSGIEIHATPPVKPNGQTVVIARVPENPCGDVNGDGKIDESDLVALKAAVATLQVIPGQGGGPLSQWNTFPDNTIDDRDVAVLEDYLEGQLLTLPLGDVNYDWRLTTADILGTRLAILGTRPLRGFQVRQADMNGNGAVSTMDIMLMRRAILGLPIGR